MDVTVAYRRLQQQLVTTQEQLDRQLSWITRLHNFVVHTLVSQPKVDLGRSIVEAMVEIFDTSLGCIWWSGDKATATWSEFSGFEVDIQDR